jgi:type I restriction enzyme S subunit
VAKVDELMGICDRLEVARKEREAIRDGFTTSTLGRLSVADESTFRSDASFAIEHLRELTTRPDQIKQLRQTILNLAIRGKLVPQDPNDEPYRIRHTETLETAEAPFQVPTTWVWAHLSSLGKLRGGGTPSKANAEYWDGNIPWVSPKDMKVDYLYDAQLKISSAAIENSSTQLLIPESILLVVRGMILAHSFPVAISRVRLAINQDMKALELYDSMISEYLLRALKGLTPLVLRKVQRSSHGTCRLESADYAALAVPLPPLAEQQRIATEVDRLMALCDGLETRLKLAEENCNKVLSNSLVDAII